jgi:hypothetical protein
MKTISLFLLFTLGSLQNYGPYARPWRGGNHSVAAAHGNVLLVWSEADASGRARVRVVMLDSAGRGISPIRTLPALTDSRDALVPAVATDGTSFLVTWEEALGVQQTVVMALDRDGAPIGEPHALTNDAPILSTAYEPSRVRWTGSEYVVINSANAQIGVTRDAQSLGAAGANSLVQADIRKVRAVNFGFPTNLGAPRYWIYVDWRVGVQSSGSVYLGIDIETSAPVIARAGNRHVVVWTGNNALSMRYTDESSTRSYPAEVDPLSRPRVQCGSTHCFVAWATKRNDIAGFVFDHQQPAAAPAPFTASASPATEREAELAMITNTRALITWRSTEADGEHLAGRPISLPSKQRAVR